MKSLSTKLSLLFLGIALLSVGVVAIWINQAVNVNFNNYCMSNQACVCDNATGAAGYGRNMGVGVGWGQQRGEAENIFIEESQRSLMIAAIVAIILALGIGYVISTFVTRPMRQLSLSAHKIADGDLTQRVARTSDDEIGEVGLAFNLMAEELEKKEKSRKQLLADIAHELRNPLSIVQGNLEAWLDGVITPTPNQIASVYDETILLNRLITDLRELSLAEAGQLKLHPEHSNLGDLIESETTAFQTRCKEKGVTLGVEISQDLPAVSIDRDRIKQVLHNLLENALRFTSSGGSISIRAGRGKGSFVQVDVEDTGSGIGYADLPYVFDHFYKADKSRHRSYGNTGIGLSLVKEYIELHGGTVRVESEVGKGSTFSFTLPVA